MPKKTKKAAERLVIYSCPSCGATTKVVHFPAVKDERSFCVDPQACKACR